MLTIELLGGLCNRMNALDSVIFLSQTINRPLNVIWSRNRFCNCRFDHLFEIPKSIRRIYQPSKPFYYAMRLLHKSNLHKLLYEKVFSGREIAKLRKEKYNFELLAKYRSVFLQGFGSFFPSNKPHQYIRPVKPIQDIIDSYVDKFNSNTIGVHIRRSDHEASILYSPTIEFIKLMKVEVERDPHSHFFLATDSPHEELKLRKEFPNRITVYSKTSLNRNSPEAIKDALVDLYCLSKTSKLIGSCGSTFTATAARINNIEKTISHTNSSEL